MTTSFTRTEFGPEEEGFDTGPEYPKAFGITFTPKVTGITLGVGGFLLAAYLFANQVMPRWSELSQLSQQKQEKEEQLSRLNTGEIEQIIARKKAELEEVKALKEELFKFFTQTDQLDTLLLDVSNFANRAQVKINSYVPAGEKTKITDNSLGEAAANNIAAQTFNLDFEGTFTQLKSFLRDLERLQPLLVVENLNVSVSQLPKLKTTIALKAIFPDLQPPAAENQQQQQQQQPQ